MLFFRDYVRRRTLTRLIVLIILQCMPILNRYVILPKLR